MGTISENPSIKELQSQIEKLELFKIFLPKESRKELRLLKRRYEEYKLIPDEFNKHFGERGWIAHESMRLDAMKEAIEFAKSNNFQHAESFLIEEFSPRNIEMKLIWLKRLEPFNIRYPLLLNAFDDYEKKRFHSTIPLVLMLMDGIVSDITKSLGLFAEGNDLKVWDSIAGHSTGLASLAKLMGASRKSTKVEHIQIPYRNGILHGRDLGYANVAVAAKTWAALFAVFDWATAVTREPVEIEEDNRSLLQVVTDFVAQRKEDEKLLKKAREWKPHSKVFSKDEDCVGFDGNCPEGVLITFLNYWKKGNYFGMGQCLHFIETHKKKPKEIAGEIRSQFQDLKLESYRLLKANHDFPGVSSVLVGINGNITGKKIYKELLFEFRWQDDEEELSSRIDPKGKCKIFNSSSIAQEIYLLN